MGLLTRLRSRPATGMLVAMTQRLRDLLLVDIPGRLVIACDVIGGIGNKPHDSVPTDPRTCANFGFRVPMLELLCSGARPVAVVDTLSVERHPTGQIMIDEILRLAAEAGLGPEAVTGSTEDNVVTTATGLGITILGVLAPGAGLPMARRGDVVVCLGEPRSAPADRLYISHPAMVTIAEVKRLLDTGLVHDALPVGSRGVGHELAEMAAHSGTQVRHDPASSIPPEQSAGPASCVLISCSPGDQETLKALVPQRSWQVIGRLE